MNLHHVRELYTRVEEMPFNSETKYMAVRCRPSYGEVRYIISPTHVTGQYASKTSPCVIINRKVIVIVNMPTIVKVCSSTGTVMLTRKT